MQAAQQHQGGSSKGERSGGPQPSDLEPCVKIDNDLSAGTRASVDKDAQDDLQDSTEQGQRGGREEVRRKIF